jgi:hypothetical protein
LEAASEGEVDFETFIRALTDKMVLIKKFKLFRETHLLKMEEEVFGI